MQTARYIVLFALIINFLPVIRFRKTKYFYFFIAWLLIDPIYLITRHTNLVPEFNYFSLAYIISFIFFPGYKHKARIIMGSFALLSFPYFVGDLLIEQIVIITFALLFLLLIVNELIEQINTKNEYELFLIVFLVYNLLHWAKLFLYYNKILVFVEWFTIMLIIDLILMSIIIWAGPDKKYKLKEKPAYMPEDMPVEKGEELNFNLDLLSRQELKVLLLFAEGKDYNEIAGQLFIEKKTVQNHLNKIKNKLSIESVPELKNLAPKFVNILKNKTLG